MKTAISIKEAESRSSIDKHFGRCAFFYILDESSGQHEYMVNPGKSVKGCRADVIAGLLVSKGVKRVIAGDFGTHVQQILNQHQIQLIIDPDERRTLSELLIMITGKSN